MASSTVPNLDTSNTFIASYAQERLWYIERLGTASAIYNMPAAFRLTGPLCFDTLIKSINAIARRHESLRTKVQWQDGRLVQLVDDSLNIGVSVLDISSFDEEERDRRLQDILHIQAKKPIIIEKCPLFRVLLIKESKLQHVFFFMPHHIIWDEWSFDIFLLELESYYEAIIDGIEPTLPELSIQYADYAAWHRDWLKSPALREQLAYWKNRLSGDLPVLELYTDRLRPEHMSYAGSAETFELPANHVEELIRVARRHDTALNIVILTAINILLHRYSAQEDIIVGSLIEARMRPELEKLIGNFENTLIIRTHIKSDMSISDLLVQVRAACNEAYRYRDTPFEQLIEAVDPKRDLSRTAIFQCMFTYQDVTSRSSKMADINISQLPIQNEASPTDLNFSVKRTNEGIIGALQYSTELFDRRTAIDLVGGLCTLLRNIVSNTDTRVGEIGIISESQQEVLDEFKGASGNTIKYPNIITAIDKQVDARLESIAVGFEGRVLSYNELDQKANQLARYLQSLDVGPEVLVGVLVERSDMMVVTILSILKAGGAYVPMDPEYPMERLTYMLDHSGVSVLLTQSGLLGSLPDHQAKVVCVDSDWNKIAEFSTDRPTASIKPGQLAYVIYTSGSTGKPKGVQVTHGAVANFLGSMAHKPGLTSQDVLLAVTTLSFDIAVLELFLPLTVGGRIEIASREAASDPKLLLLKLYEIEATVMQAAPVTWRLLLSSGWEGKDSFKVLIGGEALPRDLVNKLIDRVGGVWNMYGPTETTVWSTCEYLSDKNSPISIGTPINNTYVLVLDEYQQQVPVGVPGELYIGGAGVCRGYLNAAVLTDERFIQDPFNDDPDKCIYRTGDQVRLLRDGRLEYLSRMDYQVKIRGFRIELGEIETSLLSHPAVRQAVVTKWEERPGDARLVAYVIVEQGDDITVTEMRRHLRSSLPEYMIPQHMVRLDELPMTPNVKIDRNALPPPLGGVDYEEATYVAPRTELERLLVDIWKVVLKIDRVGIYDNFFNLGGHSLLSMQVITMLEADHDIKLSPRAMLLNNLEQLAQQCELPCTGESKIPGENKDSGIVKLLDRIKTRFRI